MKTVLVTGASGFIGRHCVPRLLSAGYEVHGVSTRKTVASIPNLRWHQADIFDGPSIKGLIRNVSPTHLLHLAWVTEHGKFWDSPENLRCVAGSLMLLRAFREAGGVRVVAAGTCAEYDWTAGVCSEASTPVVPATLYGVSKQALGAIMASYAAQSGLSSAWGRVFFPYGPGEHPSKLVASVINALLANRPARCSSGEQRRDFIHVDDVGSAFVTLLDSTVTGPVNIGSGVAVPVRDVVLEVGELRNQQNLIRLGELPMRSEPPLVVADVNRLVNEVGWKARFDLSSGLLNTIQWWENQVSDSQCAQEGS